MFVAVMALTFGVEIVVFSECRCTVDTQSAYPIDKPTSESTCSFYPLFALIVSQLTF